MSGTESELLDASGSDGDEGSLFLACGIPSAPDRFDEIVSALEECVMGGDVPLQAELETWCRANCAEFGTVGEGGGDSSADPATHPVAWMSLFTLYSALIEERLEAALFVMTPPAELAEVETLFTARADELAADVFDVLFSLGDYDEFVSLMRSYNEQVAYEEGRGGERGAGLGFAGLAPSVIKSAR